MKTYFAALLAPLVGVVALNTTVDTSGLSTSARVSTLERGSQKTGVIYSKQQLDQRAWVRARLTDMNQPCPDVLVLGSSTVGEISSDMLTGRRLLNAYMGGPMVEDFEAVTMFLRHAGCHVETIIVGADPWWLGNATIDDKRWLSLLDAYMDFNGFGAVTRTWTRAQADWAVVEERLSFAATRESFRAVRYGSGEILVDEQAGSFCAAHHAPVFTIAADGHNIMCEQWYTSDLERRRLADEYLRVNQHQMAEWREVDAPRVSRFLKLTEEWSRDADRVVVVGMPYNPITFERLMASKDVARNLRELDAMLSGATRRNVSFISLRDPAIVGCTENEFEDSHHSRPSCVAKVVRAVDSR